MDTPPNAELDAARRELQELYRQLAMPRPFSWSRMRTQRQIARVKGRIAALERAQEETRTESSAEGDRARPPGS